MGVYKFRVVIDLDEDVFRDIEIKDSQTFEDFHGAIIAAFEFRGDQMASFYMSNDAWEKGLEIGLMDLSFGEEAGPPTMKTTELKSLVKEVNQKVLYVYDFLKMWIFYIELMEVKEEDPDQGYPCLAMAFGDAPNEDDKELEDLFEGIEEPDSKKDSIEDEIDDILNEYDDDYSPEGGFENIDDLDI